jgi:hypothetical protein
MYEEYVSFRTFFLFFFSPSAGAATLAVFFAPFTPSVVLAGAFEAVAVDAGALPAVEAGLGAIAMCGVKEAGKEI